MKNSRKIEYSKNLDGKIEGLVAGKYLTDLNVKVLHELRSLGNEAVHKIAKPSFEELTTAIEILEQALHNIYELPALGARLKQAKARRLT